MNHTLVGIVPMTPVLLRTANTPSATHTLQHAIKSNGWSWITSTDNLS